MKKNLKKFKRNSIINLSPNYTFSAPPYDLYDAFQPGGFYKIYHRVQAEKMKRSYDWLKTIQENLPPEMNCPKGKILDNESGEQYNEVLEQLPIISPSNGDIIFKVELGDDDNRKIVYIDVEDIEVQ